MGFYPGLVKPSMNGKTWERTITPVSSARLNANPNSVSEVSTDVSRDVTRPKS